MDARAATLEAYRSAVMAKAWPVIVVSARMVWARRGDLGRVLRRRGHDLQHAVRQGSL